MLAKLLVFQEPLIPETEKLVEIGTRVLVTIAIGVLLQRLFFLLVARVEKWVERVGHGSSHAKQRSSTIGQLLRNMITVLVMGAVVIHVLAVLGWDVRPLLAGAGILGVALGFGAQSLVRDVIAGIFVIAEDQYGVGDVIEVNGKPATVEALSMRSTTLRDFNGFVHYVPNGEMKIVTNRSRGWNRVAIDVPVAADQSVDRAIELCRAVASEMNEDPVWKDRLIQPIDVWGVETLAGNDFTVRLVLRGRPGPDTHEAARELRRRVHRALIENKMPTSIARDLVIRGWPDVPAGAPPASAVEPSSQTESQSSQIERPSLGDGPRTTSQQHEPVSET
jgi:small conductance mechanosensitive channel